MRGMPQKRTTQATSFHGVNIPHVLPSGGWKGDLPIEQPTTLALVASLETTKAIRVRISPSMLAWSNEAIPRLARIDVSFLGERAIQRRGTNVVAVGK